MCAGIPAIYLFLLVRNHDRINPAADSTPGKLVARSRDETLAPVAFLFKYVKPERWWFEVADALRRVIMIGGLVFVEDQDARKAAVGFGLSAASLILFREAEPYLTVSCNVLATIAQWQLIVTCKPRVPLGVART